MNTTTVNEKAAEAGKEAFKSGRSAVPSLDAVLMELIEGVKVGHAMPILEAWVNGWHEANLAGPDLIVSGTLEFRATQIKVAGCTDAGKEWVAKWTGAQVGVLWFTARKSSFPAVADAVKKAGLTLQEF